MASGSDFESTDPLEAAGLSILRLLQRAADTADQNRIQALDTAQRLSQELRAAQDRIAKLEDDVAAYRDRAERAELWLDKIRTELEQQFPRNGRARRYD
jgi:predicted  nucleic acid-binding Zn-ribbon protein